MFFFFLETKGKIKIKHETTQKTKKTLSKISKKEVSSSDFLNRYDFAYAGRDTVNQFGKIALGLIKNACSEINNIAQQTINQTISQGGNKNRKGTPKYF